jgi:hypothetical protein
LRRGRDPVAEKPEMSWRRWIYNPPVVGSFGRGTGKLAAPEQGTIRRFRSGSGKEQAAENGARDRTRPGCKTSRDSRPSGRNAALASGWTNGAAQFVQTSSCSSAWRIAIEWRRTPSSGASRHLSHEGRRSEAGGSQRGRVRAIRRDRSHSPRSAGRGPKRRRRQAAPYRRQPHLAPCRPTNIPQRLRQLRRGPR